MSDSLYEQLIRAVETGQGLVLCPSRSAALAALGRLRLQRPECPIEAPQTAPGDPFTPLTGPVLSAALEGRALGAVVDATAARPWDDVVWAPLLRELAGAAVVLAPERWLLGQSTFTGAALAPSQWLEDPRDEPAEDDAPALRRLVMDARHLDDDRELLLRLLRLGEYEGRFGTTDRALAAFEEGLLAARRHAGGAPEDPQRLHGLAALLDAKGDALARLDRVDEAAATYAESRDVSLRCQALRAQTPQAPGDARWGSAVSALRVGQAALAFGDYAGGMQQVEEAVDQSWWGLLSPERQASVWARIADVRALRGQLAAAHEAFEATSAGLRVAFAASPRRFDLRAALAESQLKRAGLALATQDRALAQTCLQEAAAQLTQALSREPAHRGWRALSAALHVAEADWALSEGLIGAAGAYLDVALRAWERLISLDSARLDWRLERARVQRRLVYCRYDTASSEADLSACRAALEARASDPARQHELAQALSARAWLSERTGGPQTAALWRDALDVARASADRLPAFRRTRLRCEDGVLRTSGGSAPSP